MKITRREKQIIQLVANELTTKEIAARLYISNETVTTHRQNLMEKLQAKNAAGLIRRGFESGLLRVAMMFILIFNSNLIIHAQERPLAIETDTSHAVRMGVPLAEAGNKLYWEPKNSQLLVGSGRFLFANTWDLDQVGNFSTTFGSLNSPYANHSMVWGQANLVNGDFGTAWGNLNRASGYASTAMGEGTIAKGYGGMVVGVYNDTIQGQANQQIFSNNTPLLVVGNGLTDNNRSTAMAVYGTGFMKIGNGAASADLHIRQSENLGEGGTGGILLEAISNDFFPSTALWKIQASSTFLNKYLNFNLSGNRVSYIDFSGNYVKVENFVPQDHPLTKSNLQIQDISKIEIGINSISKSKKSLTLNAYQFLQDFPEMVVHDENGDPFGIDYRQLHLTAIAALQEEIITNESQNNEISKLKDEISQLKILIQNISK